MTHQEETNPDTCQHYRIDNTTWQCKSCGQRMEEQTIVPEYVLSAPNLAAGSGVYIPDRSRQTHVHVGDAVTYSCDRCPYGGGYVDRFGYKAPCGQHHRGE